MNDGSRRKGGYAPVLFLFFPFCFLLFFGLWVVISMCVFLIFPSFFFVWKFLLL
jgi:hypothetical protein